MQFLVGFVENTTRYVYNIEGRLRLWLKTINFHSDVLFSGSRLILWFFFSIYDKPCTYTRQHSWTRICGWSIAARVIAVLPRSWAPNWVIHFIRNGCKTRRIIIRWNKYRVVVGPLRTQMMPLYSCTGYRSWLKGPLAYTLVYYGRCQLLYNSFLMPCRWPAKNTRKKNYSSSENVRSTRVRDPLWRNRPRGHD